MKKSILLVTAGCVAVLLSARQAGAMEMHGSKEEAIAMVKRGVAYIKEHGSESGYAEITDPRGRFRNGSLYLVVYRLDGMVLAHGQNRKMVNKNLIALRDIDGKPFIRETVELARTRSNFWMDHKFTNPVTRKIAPMQMYCERLRDSVICSGHFM